MRMSRRALLNGIALTSGLLVRDRRVSAETLGRSFYVSPSGSDSNAGTMDSPFRSIAHVFTAISDLRANDSVIVMPGVYSEQVVVSKGGDADGYLTLKSLIPHAAKIRSPKDTYSAVNIISSY